VRLTADELASLLRAHAYLNVQRPPTLWGLETAGLEPFIRHLGELIAAGLSRNGNQLAELVLSVANVVVTPEAGGFIPSGEYVAVSISGAGSWPKDARWEPGGAIRLVSDDVTSAVLAAGARSAYCRWLGPDSGSITTLFPRSDPPVPAPTPAG